MVLLRSATSATIMYLLFIALKHLPIGLHSILFNFGPFFSLILGTIILREIIPTIEVINMIVSFCGVFLVIYNSKVSSDETPLEGNARIMFIVSIALVLVAALMTSFAGIIVKKIKEVHYSIVNTIFGFFVTIVAIPAWYINRYIVNEPVEYGFTKFQIFLMVLIGILSTASN